MKLGGKREARRAYTEWNSLVRDGMDMSCIGPRAYNFLYVLLSRVGMVDEAMDVHGNCVANGYYMNRYSYNAFLNACAKSYRIADAFETLRAMAESNVLPDVVSFNVLIACCVRSGDLDIALGILHRMRDWGISPDVYSYNSVVNGLRKNRMLREAFLLVGQMETDVAAELGHYEPTIVDALSALPERDNKSLKLNEVSRTQKSSGSPLISALTAARRHSVGLDRVSEVADQMSESGQIQAVGPDLVTYNTLISGLAGMERPVLELAMCVKQHMEDRRFVCNEVTYNAMMAVAARAHRSEDAFAIYDEMISRRLRPSSECFTTLISLCGRAKMMQKAFEIHGHMISCGVGPSVITFNALLSACRWGCALDGGERALNVLKEMRGLEGCTPDVISYSTVIDSLGRCGRFEEMRDVLAEMGREGIEPNLVTYTSVITALTRAGNLNGAMVVLREMEGHGVTPNVYTFSSLIYGAGKGDEFDRALELFEMMRGRGIMASRVTYTMLLDIGMRTGEDRHLRFVIDEMAKDERLRGTRQMERIEEAARVVEREGAEKKGWAFKVMNEALFDCVGHGPGKFGGG